MENILTVCYRAEITYYFSFIFKTVTRRPLFFHLPFFGIILTTDVFSSFCVTVYIGRNS